MVKIGLFSLKMG